MEYKKEHGRYPYKNEIKSKRMYFSFQLEYYGPEYAFTLMRRIILDKQNLDIESGTLGEIKD